MWKYEMSKFVILLNFCFCLWVAIFSILILKLTISFAAIKIDLKKPINYFDKHLKWYDVKNLFYMKSQL